MSNVVVFHNNPVKKCIETKSYIISIPADKKPKLQKLGAMAEINLDTTLKDIEGLIENTERAVVHIKNLSLACSNCGTCNIFDLFRSCLRVKISDNNVTL